MALTITSNRLVSIAVIVVLLANAKKENAPAEQLRISILKVQKSIRVIGTTGGRILTAAFFLLQSHPSTSLNINQTGHRKYRY